MPYKREQKTNKKLKVKEEREIKKKHLSSDQEQGEICLRCWCSPSDCFVDLSLVFFQLQVLLSYSSKGKKPLQVVKPARQVFQIFLA